MTLSQSEKDLVEEARKLSVDEFRDGAAAVDESEEYPWDNIKLLVKHGFMGMTIPTEYGGKGASYLDTVLVVEQIARECATTARIVVEANMGAIGAIMRYGSDDLKRDAAALVLAGDKPAICITEPGAGSDVQAMETTAERDGDEYIINGTKHWITGGGVSKLYLIFAHEVGGKTDSGIQAFAVLGDPDYPGLEIGDREPTMGLRGIPERVLRFNKMRVPASHKLEVSGADARGALAGLMEAYNAQRIGAATVALGIASSALDLACEYALHRRQFGKSLSEFQGIKWMIADMDNKVAISRSLIHAAASAGSGFPDRVMAARAKLFTAEAAIEVASNALQIFGARGYSRRLPIERMNRDVRMFTIGGGTAQIMREIIGEQRLRAENGNRLENLPV
ncbi:acyl-CoA dehydrogenase family protein [Rhizorhapis sp. SPR117]|uniref:acyl-CoA dehydrogenase family protein n=1 Tax=Rhizorhapis sp. SPR117 TaxID=2912611 RepID=UPI001F3FD489|nr:acyl-CoA dehydrogenase family protein [Rhizorhapis sp. SPR117]